MKQNLTIILHKLKKISEIQYIIKTEKKNQYLPTSKYCTLLIQHDNNLMIILYKLKFQRSNT